MQTTSCQLDLKPRTNNKDIYNFNFNDDKLEQMYANIIKRR